MKRTSLPWVAVAFFAACIFPRPVNADIFPATTEYRETLAVILTEADFNGFWSPDQGKFIAELAVSRDGSKLGFVAWLGVCGQLSEDPDCRRLFVMNGDGSGVADVSPSGTRVMGGIRALRFNQNGSRLFYRMPLFGVDYDVYYCNTPANTAHLAQRQRNADWRVPYALNSAGTYVRSKYDDPADNECDTIGVYSGSCGDEPGRDIGLNQLPGSCNPNRLWFLGAADDADRALLTWSDGDFSPNRSMYMAEGGAVKKWPAEDHAFVMDFQDLPWRIISADGSKALYSYTHQSGGQRETYAVNLDTGAKQHVLTYNIEPPMLSPSGAFARVNAANYRATRINLSNGERRDTLSYFTGLANGGVMTDFTDDDRYYFLSTRYDTTRVYRVDMAPDDGSYAAAPRIGQISFNVPELLNDDKTAAGITAYVNDAQGAANIEWVQVICLADQGREGAEWYDFFRQPLHFNRGDPGDAPMFDDGTHGDAVAGDGIYTYDAMTTRKWVTWYTHFTLPHPVGIRILAKDRDGNYSIADTNLMITNNAGAVPPRVDVNAGTMVFSEIPAGQVSEPRIRSLGNAGHSLLEARLTLNDPDNQFALRTDIGAAPLNATEPDIQPGKSGTFGVTFRPRSAGTFDASLTIETNDSQSPTVTIPLRGSTEFLPDNTNENSNDNTGNQNTNTNGGGNTNTNGGNTNTNGGGNTNDNGGGTFGSPCAPAGSSLLALTVIGLLATRRRPA